LLTFNSQHSAFSSSDTKTKAPTIFPLDWRERERETHMDKLAMFKFLVLYNLGTPKI
jgi:hypothetical protein